MRIIGSARDLQAAGRFDEAEAVLLRYAAAGVQSIALAAAIADLMIAAGRDGDAAEWLAHGIAIAPQHAGLYDNLAAVLVRLQRFADADAVLQRGLEALPDSVSILRNRGMLLADSGRPADGIGFVRRAVELEPERADLRVDLGNLLVRLKLYGEAEAQYRTALRLQPDQAGSFNNLAAALRQQHRYAEAEAAYRRAIEVDGSYPDGWANLASLLREQGRIAEAKAAYRRALSLRHPWPEIHSNLIFCLDFDGEAGLQEQQEERRRWREANEAPFAAAARRPGPQPDPDKRLRVGYVSADFNRHSAADMFGAILLSHDLARQDVLLYSCGEREDDRTVAFARHATAFRRTRLHSDDALAELIRSDGIDILVDLSGHSGGNRLPVFARRPAPVQATGWGYATGTGLRSIDYFMADARLVPEALRSGFTERILELPCFLSYRSPDYLPDPGPLPLRRNGYPTFGSLNRLAKASTRCLALWADLLHRVEGSRLLLKCQALDDAAARDGVRQLFRQRGIAEERLDLRGQTSHLEHLQTFVDIDIALDPFPHCGGTTTCEALTMGVPVVSLCGEVPVARNGYSLLNAIGYGEWVAFDEAGYLEIAAGLASDAAALSAVRAMLRAVVRATPVGDCAAYARAVEAAYRRIWLQHCIAARAGSAAPA